jgi:Tfp pilus assembly protein FimT
MKIPVSNSSRRQNGSTVVVLLILLTIMALLSAANTSALIHLHREMKLLDHRQVERLNASQTNAVTAADVPAQPELK